MLSLDLCKALFEVGKFTLADAEWLAQNGYTVICGDGKCVEIVWGEE